jgi:Zn-dependent peptidase ImmA (M78 family)
MDQMTHADLIRFQITPQMVARAALRDAGVVDELPVDLKKIARHHGITLTEKSAEELGTLSGRVTLHPDGRGEIEYRASDPPVRQRFTIAHEIGHLLLRHVEQGGEAMRDDSKSFSRKSYDPKEAEANRFAAEILMPADTVRFMIEQSPNPPTLKSMARRFEVSELAMQYRLKNLGWI